MHTIINTQDLCPNIPLAGGWNGTQWYYDSEENRHQDFLDDMYGVENWEARSIPDRHDPPTYLAMMLSDVPEADGK